MKPTTFTVYELFEQRCRHVVPLFQRPYVWRLNDQWEPLWDDIAAKADALIANQNDKSHRTSHFMGAAVLSEIQTYGKQVKTLTVIDGQQRLTTLQIILVALRDFVRNEAKDNDLADELHKLTENTRFEDEIERFKVFPTNADRAIFSNIVQALSYEKVKQLYPIEQISRKRFVMRAKTWTENRHR